MIKRVSYIKDVLGNDYLGIKFSSGELDEYIEKWLENHFEKILNSYQSDPASIEGFDKINTLRDNKKRRDGDDYHLTLLSVPEYGYFLKNDKQSKDDILKDLFSKDINDLVFEGVGKAVKNSNEAHYIVVNSEGLNAFRTNIGLSEKDLHITLGFDEKDVFGVDKGKGSIYFEF